MKRTGGTWDPLEPPVYFLAAEPRSLGIAALVHDHLLIAVNELEQAEDIDRVTSWCRSGKKVFLDSGVFNLANTHAVSHNMTMDAALGLAPGEIDGFDDLFARYVELVRRLGDDLWGYIEIDQGGLENKRRTRSRLEGMGIAPIPVYHPLNDGWDYFDELAGQYDRMCLGNVVQADQESRKRLVTTAWHRRRDYPNLWIHCLGLTPGDWYNGVPLNSCDSSTWLGLVRWADAFPAKIANGTFGKLSQGVFYDPDADPASESGHLKARRLGAYDAHMMMLTLRGVCSEYVDALGCDPGMYSRERK